MNYLDWLLGISLSFVLAERLRPARREQGVLRRQLLNDVFYLLFNGHFYAVLTGTVSVFMAAKTRTLLADLGLDPELALLTEQAFWLQFLVYFVASDFLQWCVHNLLHRVPWLWQFHKLHHSVREMDWAANFRFHWVELVVYRSLLYVPLLWLGGSPEPLFAVAIFATIWGHFNHSNIGVGIGPLAWVFNSPRMHMWHHDVSDEGGSAKNFGIVLSLWDYLFSTAYWPRERAPREIGYPNQNELPLDLPRQLVFPLLQARVTPR